MAHALGCGAATAPAGVGLLHHHEKAGALFSAAGSVVRVQQLSGKGSKSQAIRCAMPSASEHGGISTATASSSDQKKGGLRGKLNKVVLAYSGGLDTSVIVPWLRENYGCEVVCFTADVGQGDIELEGLEKKAKASGASQLVVKDLKEEFVSEYIYPCLRAGAVYERKYLLGTSMARPVIAKAMVDVAKEVGADAVAHGCTGKGNDQVRFELTFYALNPELKVVAPWREWDITGREDAIEYAKKHNVPIPVTKKSIYSRDRNLWHLSHEEEARPVAEMVDPALLRDAPPLPKKEVVAAFHLALACTELDADLRPRMKAVADTLDKIASS
uniref:argininosuccinate synthase n=1 Tax=Oryza barthii TaxID=65489 RepID=A0A0D3HSS8_9ORYZ